MLLRSRTLPAAVVAGALAIAACGGGGHKPAAAPSPTPSSASPTPTPSPTAVVAAAVCPLTGLPPAPGQNRTRPALAIKVDNVDVARPQVGIDHADVVVEELVEGGLTRLFAVFQCDSASRVEPIRSARTTDADLLALLHGSVFGYSGSNKGALPPIKARGNAVLLAYDSLPQYFHRDGSRPAPHNVYSSTSVLLEAGLARRKGLTAPPPMFRYGALDASATRIGTASMSWPQASAGWAWRRGAWQRTQNGTPDTLADGHRVTAANVVIMSVSLVSTGLKDVLGNASPLDVTVGQRTVWVLRNGRMIKGTWRRPSSSKPLQLLNAAGKPLLLAPGRTWIELLPGSTAPVLR